MKTRCLPLAATLASLVLSQLALAQSAAPSPGVAASAPQAARPTPRVMTPTEKQHSADADLRKGPERTVQKQVTIPLGKTEPAQKPAGTPVMRASPQPRGGGIDDADAQCLAKKDEHARANCLDKLASGAKPR